MYRRLRLLLDVHALHACTCRDVACLLVACLKDTVAFWLCRQPLAGDEAASAATPQRTPPPTQGPARGCAHARTRAPLADVAACQPRTTIAMDGGVAALAAVAEAAASPERRGAPAGGALARGGGAVQPPTAREIRATGRKRKSFGARERGTEGADAAPASGARERPLADSAGPARDIAG
eukprot:363353-Chlamydomonas_euryale.AAC.11